MISGWNVPAPPLAARIFRKQGGFPGKGGGFPGTFYPDDNICPITFDGLKSVFPPAISSGGARSKISEFWGGTDPPPDLAKIQKMIEIEGISPF